MGRFLSKKRRLPQPRPVPRLSRLQVAVLEDRHCPTAILFAGFVPNTAMLNITEMFSSGGPASSLTIGGNTPPGGGPTSMITVEGGSGTTVNGTNGITFTAAFPGAIASINVTMLNDDNSITVGTATGMVNLPSTTLNVTEGSGNDTFIMGNYGFGSVPAVNNVLSAVTWKAANLNGTGTESVTILNSAVGNITVQQNSGPNDAIQVWGVTTNGGQAILNQNHGAGDSISIDQLLPPSPPPLPIFPPPPPPPNLVQNPSFETGDFTNWTLSGNASASVSSAAGGYSPHSGNDLAALGHLGAPLGMISQTVPTTVGISYIFSFWYASNGFGPNELKASIGGTTVFDQTNIPSTVAANAAQNGYIQFRTSFTATSTSTLVQFGERDDVNYLALDDVSVNALPPPPPPGPPPLPPPPVFVNITQGNGSNDNTSVNRSSDLSISIVQGNGDSDRLFLGSGLGSRVGLGNVAVSQGTGNADYIGVDNLVGGEVNILQQDLAGNATGDTIGGVATNSIPPGTTAGFPGPGLDLPSASTPANVVRVTGAASFLTDVPTSGFDNANPQGLNIVQGSAAGDLIALVQLPTGSTTSESLIVAAPMMIVQQDLAGHAPDYVFLGSYTPNPGPFTNPPTGHAPYPWTSPLATGRITAVNEVVTQGNAFGDVLSVLFNTELFPSTSESSQFTQGNGGDDAIFQVNAANLGRPFNYSGGSGGNYIQADSNNAAGTFDGGSNVKNNILGHDNNNMGLFFIDFGNVILA